MLTLNSRLPRKILSHVVSIPSEVVFRVRSRSAPTSWNSNPSSYHRDKSEVEIPAVEDLRRNGYHSTTLADLPTPETASMWADGLRLFERLANKARNSDFDKVHTITATEADLEDLDHIFFWGLNDRIVSIVSAYLKQPVAYDGFSAYYSRNDGRQAGPRLWHKDREDARMVKVAIYFTDVDELSGPYEIVKPEFGRMIDPAHYENMTSSRIRSMLKIDSHVTFANHCVGPAGTVIFTDTAYHYHRGRPPITRDRCAIFYSYFTQTPLHPYFCERSPYSRCRIKELAERLPETQRKYVLWRENLPLRSRLVPRNRVTV
jgi:hypothetical protein